MSETALHMAIADFLRATLAPHVFWSTIGHGGFRLNKAAAGRLKGIGVRAGVPDVLILHPETGVAHFIEIKIVGGTLSGPQKAMHTLILNSHARVSVCRSVQQVEQFLRSFDFPLRGTCLPQRIL